MLYKHQSPVKKRHHERKHNINKQLMFAFLRHLYFLNFLTAYSYSMMITGHLNQLQPQMLPFSRNHKRVKTPAQ